MRKILPFLAFVFAAYAGNAQVGIGTDLPNASAQLDIVSADRGVLIPRVALTGSTDETTIANGNVESLLVYNTSSVEELQPGYYYWFNNRWNRIVSNTEMPGNPVTTLVDNGDGTYTYKNEDGSETIIDIPANETLSQLEYNQEENSLVYTDEDGNTTEIDLVQLVEGLQSLTTLVENEDGSLTYTDEEGVATVIPLPTIIDNYETVTSVVTDVTAGTITYVDEDGDETVLDIVPLIKALETVTSIVDNGDGTFTYTDEDGGEIIFDANTLSVALENGVYTFTDAAGVVVTTIDTKASAIAYDNTTSGIPASNVQQVLDLYFETMQQYVEQVIEALNTIELVDNEDGSVTLVKPDGTSATVAKSDITDNEDGTYTFTNNDGTDVTVDVNQLDIVLDMDGAYTVTDGSGAVIEVIQTKSSTNLYDNTNSGLNAGNVQGALDEIDAKVDSAEEELATINLIDNNDGNVTLVKADGSEVTVAKSDITDNENGTYTFTNHDGTDVILDANTLVVSDENGLYTFTDASGTILGTIDTKADALGFDNANSDLSATTVQAGIDEVNTKVNAAQDSIQANKVVITENELGNYIVKNTAGELLGRIRTTARTNQYSNTSSGLVAENVQDALDEIDAKVDSAEDDLATINLIDKNDGNVTLVKADGSEVTVAKSDVIANGNGTYTFTNNDGTDVTVDANTLSITENNDVYTFTDGTGTIAEIDIVDIIQNNQHQLDLEDIGGTLEIGQIQNGLADQVLTTNAGGNGLAWVDRTALVKGQETLTSLKDNEDGTLTYTDEKGESVTFDANTLNVTEENGVYTFTDVAGVLVTSIDTNASGISYDNTASEVPAANVQEFLDLYAQAMLQFSGEVNESLKTIDLVDNADGSVTLVKPDGTSATVAKSDVTDNLDGTYTFTNNDGSDVIIDANQIEISTKTDGSYTITDGTGATLATIETAATTNIYDNTTSGLAATNVQSALDEIQASVGAAEDDLDAVEDQLATINLLDNEDGSVTLLKADGTSATVAKSDVTDNEDGTYTFTNNDGSDVIIDAASLVITEAAGVYTFTDASGELAEIDTNANAIGYDNTATGLTATNVQGALDEIQAGVNIAEGDLAALETQLGNINLADNGDGTFTYTDEKGDAITFDANTLNVTEEDGVYTFTDAAGDLVTSINTNASRITFDATNYPEIQGPIDLQTFLDGIIADFTNSIDGLNSGSANQVLTTNADEDGLVWVDRTELETSTTLAFDEETNELTYTNEDGDNPVLDLTALTVKAWNVEGTTEGATSNTDNIYQMGTVVIGKDAAYTGAALDIEGAVRGGTNQQGTVGANSVAFGSRNNASGSYSSVIGGTGNVASETNTSVIGGTVNAASGYSSTVFGGRNNTASGAMSAVIGGAENAASGYSSTVSGGDGNTAASAYEWVGGSYTTIYTPEDTENWDSADRLFNIGRGTDDSNRHDAFTILKDGKTGIGFDNFETTTDTTAFDQKLQVNGNARIVGLPQLDGDIANDKVVVVDEDGVLRSVAGASLGNSDKAAMPKVFYMPSVVFDTSVPGTFTKDLHQAYEDQFSTPKVSSEGSGYSIPTHEAGELTYNITYYDETVFGDLSISSDGVLTYEVIGTPTAASFMNIVFVVK